MDVHIYTDGSCLKNPNGKTGAGVLIYINNKKTLDKDKILIEISLPLGFYTNNVGELYAIWTGLFSVAKSQKFIKKYLNEKSTIHFYTDSQYTINVLTRKWKAKKNVELITWILEDLDKVKKNVNIQFHWVKAHASNEYNNRVDALAKEGAKKVTKSNIVNINKRPKNIKWYLN